MFILSALVKPSMSAPGETSSEPCGLTSLIPIGMSCRGRAEAFARRLQSRLRTLGSQVGLI